MQEANSPVPSATPGYSSKGGHDHYGEEAVIDAVLDGTSAVLSPWEAAKVRASVLKLQTEFLQVHMKKRGRKHVKSS